MLSCEAGRLDHLLVYSPCVDPITHRLGVLPLEWSNPRKPRQQRTGLIHLAAPVIDLVVGGTLGCECPGRSRPTVVMHAHAGGSGTDATVPSTHPEALRVAERVNLERGVESHRADLTPIPPTVDGNGVEAPVEVDIFDGKALDALVTIDIGDRCAQPRRATVLEHLIGLNVDAPREAARGHRARSLVGE